MPKAWEGTQMNILEIEERTQEGGLPRVFQAMAVDAASRRELLWPCYAWTATVPKAEGGGPAMNIFERTLLALLPFYANNTEAIAQSMGLEADLVKFIIDRLVQKGYVNSRLEPDSMADGGGKKNKAPEFATVTVFKERVTGRLLPYVKRGAPDYFIHEVQQSGHDTVKFDTGPTAGKKTWHHCHTVYPKKANVQPPRPRDIERLMENACFPMPDNKIIIQENPLEVWIDVAAVYQLTNPNYYLVSDGFGHAISDELSEIINDPQIDCCRGLARSRTEDWARKPAKEKKPEESGSPLQDAFNDYEEIKNYIKLIEDNRKKIKGATNEAEEIEQKKIRAEILQYLYSAFEWSLLYCCRCFPVPRAVPPLADTRNNDDITEYAAEMSRRAGFSPPARRNFFATNPNAIQRFGGGIQGNVIEPEMAPGLVYALAGALENTGHPLTELARRFPDAVRKLEKLKEDRDPSRHMQDTDITAECVDTFTGDILKYTALLLNVQLPLPNDNDNQAARDSWHSEETVNQYYDTVNEIEQYFGWTLWKKLKAEFPQMYAGCCVLQEEGDSAAEYEIAGLLQELFARLVENCKAKNSGGKRDYARLTARENAMKAGFALDAGGAEMEIFKTKRAAIDAALDGRRAVLGGVCMAFLLLVPEETLRDIASRLPNLVKLAEELKNAGHNRISGSRDTARRLKEETFASVKIILKDFI
jgi:hypothetical protein